MTKLEAMSATELYMVQQTQVTVLTRNCASDLKRLRADHHQATLRDVACFEGAAEVVPGLSHSKSFRLPNEPPRGPLAEQRLKEFQVGEIRALLAARSYKKSELPRGPSNAPAGRRYLRPTAGFLCLSCRRGEP